MSAGWLVSIVALLQQEPPLPLDRLDQAVQGLRSADAAVREEAKSRLDALCREFGDALKPELLSRATGADVEVQAVLRDQVALLDRARDARNRLALFDRLGLPSLKGRRWVHFNPGRWTLIGSGDDQRLEFRYSWGWVMSETADSLTIVGTNLRTQTHEKTVKRLPALWDKVKDRHPPELPRPGEFRDVDFRKFCRDLKGRSEPAGFERLYHGAEGGLDAPVEEALFAWAALRVGLERDGLRILEGLESRLRKDLTVEKLLAEGLGDSLWYRAHVGANQGTPRKELLAIWTTLADFPENKKTDVARRMASAYRSLVEEDERWVEPGPEALARMSRSEAVKYWAHKLRDQAAEPSGNPGPCVMIGGWNSLPNLPTNPAEHLLALGWEAIPYLVEHLDDERPTRSLQWWRDHSPGSYHLVDYGEVCLLILGILLGWDLPSDGYMLANGKKPEAKAKAVELWERARGAGEEATWVGLLESSEENGAWRAASGLLRIDAAKYLPRLLECAADPKGKLRHGILQKIAGRITAVDRPKLEALLKDADLFVLLEAARILWKTFSSESAVMEVLKQVRVANPRKEEKFYAFDSEAIEFVAEVELNSARAGLLELLDTPSEGAGRTALYQAWRCFHPRVAEKLAALLDNRGSAGYGDRPDGLRVCDRAADSLAQTTGSPLRVDHYGPIAERDRIIAEIKAGWEARKHDLDWVRLRHETLEKEKR